MNLTPLAMLCRETGEGGMMRQKPLKRRDRSRMRGIAEGKMEQHDGQKKS